MAISKLEVLYDIEPYFGGISPYNALTQIVYIYMVGGFKHFYFPQYMG
jgi:hypothetical protein